MPQSLAKIFIHIIFSTKNREPFITPGIEAQLYAFLVNECSSQGSYVHKIGGVEDHLHLLVSLPRTIAISFLIECMKKNSSRWIKTKGSEFGQFSWQRGYGAFSISTSHCDAVSKYISNQKSHHKEISFKDEYRNILRKYNIAFDEKYVWD